MNIFSRFKMAPNVSKISVVMKYFVLLNAADPNSPYKCTVEGCNSILKTTKKWNLQNHFENKHADIFQREYCASVGVAEQWKKRRLELVQNLTEMVTVNNRPFSSLYDSGFVKVIQKEVVALQKANVGDGLIGRCPAVVANIKYLSAEIKKTIRQETKDTLVSLMVDIGSANRRDILGVSIQYKHEGRLVIRSIGMIHLTASHTAAYVRDEILKCLNEFEIKPDQVVSITSDNAANMISMIKLFNRELDKQNHTETNCDEGNELGADIEDIEDIEEDDNSWMQKDVNIYDDDVIQAEISSALDEFNLIESMNEAELLETTERDAELFDMLEQEDAEGYIDLLKYLQNELVMHTMKSSAIRCAAHTLQLAVKKALKTKKIRNLIDICRIACKLMRKSKYKAAMRDNNLKLVSPRLDCSVRWNSTYIMVIFLRCL